VLARPFALVAAAVLATGVVHAQPAPPTPAPPTPAPPTPAPPTPPGPSGPSGPAAEVPEPKFPDVIQPPPGFNTDAAWIAYDGAFRDAAAGDLPLARSRLAEIAARWPGHPAEARVQTLADRLAPRPKDPRAPSNVARGELVFWSTLGGVSIAANLCAAIECSTDRELAGVYTLTVGGALALSLAASRRGIRQGQAQLYNSAQTWGAWNALMINDGFPETAEEAGVAIALQLGGLAAGIGLWQTWRPTQGDVALTNSFLLWGTVLTLFGHLAADEEPELRTVIVAGDIAILLGALVSRQVDMSRGRTLLMDVGGILGMLAGGLIAIASDDQTAAGVALMVGTGAGLAIAVAGTTDWDKATPVKVAPTVLPGPGRTMGYGVTAGFAF